MADDLTRPFIGYRSAGRRPESQQDRRAAADAPLSALRGMVSGVLGAPGDIESLIRMLPGLSEQTVLPTSEDVEKRLPMRELNQTPTGKAFTTAGQLGGGFYTGPGSPLRAVAALPSAVSRAGRDFLMSTSPVNVVKPKGGNWLAGSVERAIEPMRRKTDDAEIAKFRDLPFEDRLNRINMNRPENDQLSEKVYSGWVNRDGYFGIDEAGPNALTPQEISAIPDVAMNRWLETKLAKYMRNEMATPEDPLRALAERGIMHSEITPTGYNVARARQQAGFPEEGMAVSPMAKNWEDRADTFINELKASDLTSGYPESIEANPWLLKVPPETRVYDMLRGADEDLGFSHLTDELRNAINPESGLPRELMLKYSDLEKVTVPQAVERVAKINEWRAANKAEADMARSMGPATQVVKEYPEQGFKWVELRQPKETGKKISVEKSEMELPDMTPEMMREVAEDMALDEMLEPGTRAFNDHVEGLMTDFNRKKNVEMDESYKALEDALKYEGETMGHCVGGYCPDVVEGRSKIYSLRDKKGQPHVTIEVQPAQIYRYEELPEEIKKDIYNTSFNSLASQNNIKIVTDKGELTPWGQKMIKVMNKEAAAKWLEQNASNLPMDIVQIKGKGNRAPNPEYLPAVQDFVRSGNFGNVGDLGNAGLADITKYDDRLKQAAQEAYGSSRFLTNQEMDALMQSQRDAGFARGGAVRGYQAGGAVKAAKATAKNIGELVEKYTPEFKQWFAGSKAATPEGKPLRVFRGSARDEGEVLKNSWFTSDPAAASTFSMKGAHMKKNAAGKEEYVLPNSVVTPAYLSMKRPLVIDAKGADWNRIPFGDPRDKFFMSTDEIADFARDEKYDGVIFKNVNESDLHVDLDPIDVYATFKPEQVKSTFNKKPTSDPRVGFAKGGMVGGANFPTDDFDPARIDAIVASLNADFQS
jgi:hypothetical protein